MSLLRRPLGALSVVLAVAVATGCAERPSRSARLAETDAACFRVAGPLMGLGTPTDYPALASAAAGVAAVGMAQAQAVAGLERVRGTDVAAGAVSSGLHDLADAARALHDAAQARDPARVKQSAQATVAAAQEASDDAARADLATCGTGLTVPVDAVSAGARAVVRDDFRTTAAARCAAAGEAIRAAGDPATRSGVVRFVGAGLQQLVALVDDLATVPVAPGDEAAVADTLGAQRVLNDRIHQYVQAVAAVDTERREALDVELAGLIRAVHPKWEALGLVQCGALMGAPG